MPSPAQDHYSTDPDEQSTTHPEGPQQQLALQLFARVDAYAGRPPERALWRELLDLGIGTTRTFRAHNRTFSAATIHHVALALYFRANRAGIADVPNHQLAMDCRLERYVITGALTVLRGLAVVKTTRTNRRSSAIHVLNAGGLTWTTVRRRAAAAHSNGSTAPRLAFEAPLVADALPLSNNSNPPSGIPGIPLNPPSGIPGIPPRATYKEGYVQGSPESSSRKFGAAAVPGGREFKQQQQEIAVGKTQENDHERRRLQTRTEGLIAVLATRSRRLELPFDEAKIRDEIQTGRLTVHDLQACADRLRGRKHHRRVIENRPHRLVATLDAGGKCAVCGIRRPNMHGLCPDPPDDNDDDNR